MSLPSPLRLILPTRTFDSEEQLAEHLFTEGSAASATDGTRYLYRGQAREYRRRWPLRAGAFRNLSHEDLVDLTTWERHPPTLTPPIPLEPYTFDLPSLIPTDTRSYENHLRGGEGEPRSDEAFDETMTWFGISVCAFVVGLAALSHGDEDAAAWYSAQWENDYPHLYKLRSIGQHYGMDTGLVDATSAIPVALWFASHSFQTGDYVARNQGIVYRIDLSKLREVERWLTAMPEHEGEFDSTSIDIRDTPKDVAPRAYRQQGWSLVGWEHPRLVIRMVATGGLMQYYFATGDAPSPVNAIEHSFLVPSVDPVRTLFQRFWTRQPASLDEAQAWIDRHWNVAALRPIRIADEAWRQQLVAEMARLFDYHLTH